MDKRHAKIFNENTIEYLDGELVEHLSRKIMTRYTSKSKKDYSSKRDYSLKKRNEYFTLPKTITTHLLVFQIYYNEYYGIVV